MKIGRDRSVSRRGYGGPQADCFGETAIAINDQQLKKKNIPKIRN